MILVLTSGNDRTADRVVAELGRWGEAVGVSKGILAYMKHFGLLYGAFDFAVTDDRWYFLECNANGQFGWLEAETGLPITAAMVDLLVGVAA